MEDISALLSQCLDTYIKLIELLKNEHNPITLTTYSNHRIQSAQSFITLHQHRHQNDEVNQNKIISVPKWQAGYICRLRRVDGCLDIALIIEIIERVYSTNSSDHDVESESAARLVWLRPRNWHELTSNGFLIHIDQMVSYVDPINYDPIMGEPNSEGKERETVWVLDHTVGYLRSCTLISRTREYILYSTTSEPNVVESLELTSSLLFFHSHTCNTRINTNQSTHALPAIEPDNLASNSESFDMIDKSLKIGAWEKHTKGFGSRMLQRMGYIMYDTSRMIYNVHIVCVCVMIRLLICLYL